MNAHCSNASQRLVSKLINIMNQNVYLLIFKYENDNYKQMYFNKFSSYQFIKIIGINRCVGFFRIGILKKK